jgi:hypothetical protein
MRTEPAAPPLSTPHISPHPGSIYRTSRFTPSASIRDPEAPGQPGWNYAISLGVAGLVLAWRARPWPRAACCFVVAAWVLGSTAVMLYRFRRGDANMRSVWICSRNDAIGNAAVMLAALGVFGTGTGWPDVIVAAVMGGLGSGAAGR